ncbi:MAG: amidase [Hyphomicrobiales bacterium]|nr:amidase [Hyphomicrobiales bacterium]
MNPADLSACDMIEAFRRRTLSPVEALEATLSRVEAMEPAIMALWAEDFDGARATARASEARWLKGEPLGPIDGVPVTIKENIASKGCAMPLGTAAIDLVPSETDAPPTARIRESGGAIFARTTMPDYGMLSSSKSSFHKLTRNPWDRSKTPGGSSSGAGAAAAAGYGPLHIGTDIGGSVRLPAGWCGIFTLKPSLGRIPIDPPFQGRVAGPMTRTVADAALFMRVLSRPDARDHMNLPPADIDWGALDRDLKGLRVGLHLDAGAGLAALPEVRAAVEAAARAFEQAGCIVEPLKPFLTREMLDGQDRFWRARAFADVGSLPEAKKAKILPFIRAWAESATRFSGQDIYSGFAESMALRKATEQATRRFDYVLSPTAPIPAFPAELPSPTNDPERPFEHIAFTLPYNMSEQPASSVNCGYTADGLPIGLQIAGRRFDDLGVLQMSRAWEKMRPKQRAWPTAD